MRQRRTALGYLRSDVSGTRQEWDEVQIRSRARRLGYDLAKIVVFGPRTDHPIGRLMNVVRSLGVNVVITPSIEHFEADVPDGLVQVADVITVTPQRIFARWVIPPVVGT